MKDKILEHRKVFSIIDAIFLIFIGCFAFPVYNFSKDAPEISRWINVFVALTAYYEIGVMQGALFESKGFGKSIYTTVSMTMLGLLCRFYLEYGEVSNTWNFIWPNITLHLFVAVVVTLGGQEINERK